ncbi:MAG: translocation/assembly module TamB domain-containing protein [Candidatus Methylumidiphilus sp.]
MLRVLLWSLAGLLLLPVLLLALALLAANTEPGRAWLERNINAAASGSVQVSGLAGHFPEAIHVGHVELRDAAGVWLAIDRLALDWSPRSLLSGELDIEQLSAEKIVLERLPPPSAEPEPEPTSSPSLPLPVSLRTLRVGRLDLGQPVAGQPASLNITGTARLRSMQDGEAQVQVKRLDGEGTYAVDGHFVNGAVKASLTVQEPPHGLLLSLAGIEENDALAVEAQVDGPLSALQTRLALAFGPLRMTAAGALDLDKQAMAGVAVDASAPAMRPKPDIAWQSLALKARVDGPFAKPNAEGHLRVDGLAAAGAGVKTITLDVQGDARQAQLRGELAGITLPPGPKPDLLQAAPLAVQADARWDEAARPVSFALKHPLFSAEGKLLTGGDLRGEVVLGLADLQPLAALGGQNVLGKSTLKLRFAQQNGETALDLDSAWAVTGGAAPIPQLLGDAKLALAAKLRGADVELSRLQLDGKALALALDGALAANVAQFKARLDLKDLAAANPAVSGRLGVAAQINGPLDKFSVSADIDGEVEAKGLPRGPLAAKLRLDGLPNAPVGQVTASGQLGGAPLELDVAAQPVADGGLQVDIHRADWKSAHGEGGLTLPKGALLPLGNVDLRLGHLEDLRPFIGQAVAGSVSATLATTMQGAAPRVHVQLAAHDADLPGQASVGLAELDLSIADPLKRPLLDGQLTVQRIAAGAVGGAAHLQLAGPLDALKLDLSAALDTQVGAVAVDTAILLDTVSRQLALAALTIEAKQETLRLLSPAQIRFGAGLAVDHLRLGLREATLELAGQISPRLDLTAALRGVTADLAKPFVEGLDLAGQLQADARLGGSLARPSGTVSVEAEGWKMRSGPGRALPPLRLRADAELHGALAQVEAHASAGPELKLNLGGQAPFSAAGEFDLHLDGGVDLKLLDPLLTADGRRARGQLALDGGFAGTLAAPKVSGNAQLSGGDMQDFAAGAHLSDISVRLDADGHTIKLSKLDAKAGPGKLTASGEVDLGGEGMPVAIMVNARNARPLASDRLSVNLNAELAVAGPLQGEIGLNGAVHLIKAEIRIPERLPTSVAVLNVRRPGASAEPAAEPPPPRPIALDLRIDAPGQIFVRGRGLDAELGGKIHVRGTAAQPQPEGSFTLRRGEFSLASQTLVFNKGEIGFNGGNVADPTLNFVAKTTSANVTAFLNITGTARQPKITLSSTPELPQDEVLAQLLFGRSAASLSPMELVQIAAAVASLSGATAGLGNPIDSIRKTLGLDRLSVGATLEAGRYVAPGVYVGAKQGVTGGNTQATVQIDLLKGLKLEGAVGTGGASNNNGGNAGANSVGIIYQYEY